MTDIAANGRLKRLILWLLIALISALFVYNIRTILLPFVLGMLTAYFLDPAADRLQRAGFSRGLSTVIITVLFFSGVGLAALLIIPVVVHQSAELINALPDYAASLQAQYAGTVNGWLARIEPDQVDAIKSAAGDMSSSLTSAIGGFVTGLFASVSAFVNVIMLLLITPLVAFYLLRDWDALVVRVDALLPRAHMQTIREQLAIIDLTLAGFIRGQMNVCLIMAAYYALLLSLVGLHFGFVIGFVTGLLVILPYVGFLLGVIVSVSICLFQFGFGIELALLAAVFSFAQLMESYYLTPKLVGNRVGLHPLWIIFGMLAGAALFGFVGVLLAVPLTAIAGVLIRFAVSKYVASSMYYGR